jgi:hypothetical protein
MATNGPDPSVAGNAKPFLQDPYKEWAQGEGIPIHLDFGHDLIALETAPWARYDARGCFAFTHGAGDFMSNYVIEVPAGKKTRRSSISTRMFCYVLTGQVSTMVWLPDGSTRSFEWAPRALFAIPLNCQYQIFNNSGLEPARVSCTHDGPITINLYHNLDFVFDNPATFPTAAACRDIRRRGDLHSYVTPMDQKHRNVWETNFVHDLMSFKLYELEARGKGSSNVSFILADGTMHRHCSQISRRPLQEGAPACGRHPCARRRWRGLFAALVRGRFRVQGIPLEARLHVHAPFWMFHQHFNTCDKPARYVACSLGSPRYPFIALRRKSSEGGGAVSVQQGGRQIEYEDQDPRIHRKWLEAMPRPACRRRWAMSSTSRRFLRCPLKR